MAYEYNKYISFDNSGNMILTTSPSGGDNSTKIATTSFATTAIAAGINYNATAVTIGGGQINNTSVGGVTATTGRFTTGAITTLNAASTVSLSGTLTLTGALVKAIRVVPSGATVTVGATDQIIVINKATGSATAVNLPATPATGRRITIKDGKGDANSNAITITPAAGNIDAASTFVLGTSFGTVALIYNGSSWSVLTAPANPTGEATEATRVTTVGPTINASTTNRVASSGPFNQFLLATDAVQPPFDLIGPAGANQGGFVTALVYHNHTLFEHATDNSTFDAWWYWNTTLGDYVTAGPGLSYFMLDTAVGINLSTTSYIANAAAGTTVATISASMVANAASDTFPGNYGGVFTLGGTDAANFAISGTNLNVAAGHTLGAGPYNITISATFPVGAATISNGISNTPFTLTQQSAVARRAGTRLPYPSALVSQSPTVQAWPFSELSVWNLGIGSGALFDDSCTPLLLAENPPRMTFSNPGDTSGNEWTYPIFVGSGSDPLYTYTPAGWPFGNPQPGTIHVPSNAKFSGDSDQVGLFLDSTDPQRGISFDNGATLNTTNHTISAASSGNGQLFNLARNGVPVWGQGNTYVAVQGADLDNMVNGIGIYRMLSINIKFGTSAMAKAWDQIANHDSSLINKGFYNSVWPIYTSDFNGGTGAGSLYNSATVGPIPLGSVLYIPKTILDMSSWVYPGTNPQGLSRGAFYIAKQLQDYGAVVVNTGGSVAMFSSWDTKTTTQRSQTHQEIADFLFGNTTFSGGATLLSKMRVMRNWMIGMAPGQLPASAPGAGYQYDPNYNPNAPINGGGTYPLRAPLWANTLPAIYTNQNSAPLPGTGWSQPY